jgi:alkylation response protein AidB-like acyl-CoA dehydrogenase
MIYEMITETEAGQLLGYRALDLADKGERCRKEASMAKAYATEAAVRVTSMAIEIHGAMGLSQDLALERYFRDARTWTIPDGTTEIQKLIVAGEVLGIRAYV